MILFILGSANGISRPGDKLGTFGIMLPIAAAMATNSAIQNYYFLVCLQLWQARYAATTVHRFRIQRFCRQLGQKCNHMDHVTTQLPYAATVATASAVGYIVVGFTESGLAGFVTTAVVLVALVFIVKNVKA